MEVYNIREHVRIGKSKIFKIMIFLREAKVESSSGIRRDGHLLFEVEMYLQKGCIMVSGVGSS